MSAVLPPEILDLIVDQLQNEPTTLKACCLVSKSLVPRTRKHLFARVEFRTLQLHVELWKKAFPDPSRSPAHYTRSLFVVGMPAVTAADADVGGWISTFDSVVNLHVEIFGRGIQHSLLPLHGLSPTLKSLRLVYTFVPSPEALGLVCSFPLLEDLSLVSFGRSTAADRWNTPFTSPKFTGSLDLSMMAGIRSAARQLCDIPGGLRFVKITLSCLIEDLEPAADLVSRCSNTLESLSVSFSLPGLSRITSLDLSGATKLKDLTFGCGRLGIWWIAAVLRTIRSKNLQQITICPSPSTFANPIGERIHLEWLDLDFALTQLCTSRSIRPQVTCEPGDGGKDIRYHSPTLLPEVTRRGLIDLVECPTQLPGASTPW